MMLYYQDRVVEQVKSILSWLSVNNIHLNLNMSNLMQFLIPNKSPDTLSLDEFEMKDIY